MGNYDEYLEKAMDLADRAEDAAKDFADKAGVAAKDLKDKAEVVGLAKTLDKLGYEIWATRGTSTALWKAGIESNALYKIPLGSPNTLEVLHAPGHTDDSCAFWCEEGGFALVGDTVYEGGPGLTVFPTGDERRLYESIRKKLLPLPPSTVLLSGHSRPMTVEQLSRVVGRN